MNFSTICENISTKIFDMRHTVNMLLTTTASMDNIPGQSCRICKELSPKRFLRSRHYFADSCKAWADDSVTVRVRSTRLVCHAHSILHVRHSWKFRPSKIWRYTVWCTSYKAYVNVSFTISSIFYIDPCTSPSNCKLQIRILCGWCVWLIYSMATMQIKGTACSLYSVDANMAENTV